MKKKLLLALACITLLPLSITSCGETSSSSSSLAPSSEVSTGEDSSSEEVSDDYCVLTTNFDNQVGGTVNFEVKHANGSIVDKKDYQKLVPGDVICIKSVKANDGYKAISLFVNSVMKNDGGHSEIGLDLDLLTPSGAELTSIELEVEPNTESIELVVTFEKIA